MAYNGAWLWHTQIALEILDHQRPCSACRQNTSFRLFIPGYQFVQYCCLLRTSCAQRAGNKLARMLIKRGKDFGVFSFSNGMPESSRRPELARRYVREVLLPDAIVPVRRLELNGSAANKVCRGCYKVVPKVELLVAVLGTRLSIYVCPSCQDHEEALIIRQARAFAAQELRHFWHQGVTMQLAIQNRCSH